MGHSLTLNCTVTGGPIKSIDWLHNGRLLNAVSSDNGSELRVRFLSREMLHIRNLARIDKGIYQCIAYNDVDSALSQVQLELRGEHRNPMDGQAWPRLVNRPERDSG